MNPKTILLTALITGIIIINSLTALGTIGPDSIVIHNIGHASLMFEYNYLIIHIDPLSSQADYAQLPDADIIFVTHGHGDHYDISSLNNIKQDSTHMIYTQNVASQGTYTGIAHIMNNGDSIEVKGIPVKAVPAYNMVNTTYHPKGVDNGYVITLGEKNIYIAGDIENIPEMDRLGKIDIAFLPMNLPHTMTPEMAADATKRIHPDILYIYHFGSSDTAYLRSLLSNEDLEIRIGKSIYYEKPVREEQTGYKPVFPYQKPYIYPNPAEEYLVVKNDRMGSFIVLHTLHGQLVLN